MRQAREIAETIAKTAGIWVAFLAVGFVAASIVIGLIMIATGKEMTISQQWIFGVSVVIFVGLQLAYFARKS